MSYDLMFRFRSGKESAPVGVFVDYFKSRPLYQVSESQAVYSNQTTGVYFVFDLGKGQDDPEAPPSPPDVAPVAFNINYYRPHFFGLEAEPELSAFVRHFDLTVIDPQNEGLGEGEYSREGFLRGWNAGNEFGYRAILPRQDPEEIRSLPTKTLDSLWRWNYTRDLRQKERGESIFVPRIFFFDYRGSLCTGVAWGDGIPILMPRVDLLLVPLIGMGRKKLFSKKTDMVMFAWHEMEDLITRYPFVEEALPAYLLDYQRPPENLVKRITSRKPPSEKPQGIAPDQILNQELIEKVRTEKP